MGGIVDRDNESGSGLGLVIYLNVRTGEGKRGEGQEQQAYSKQADHTLEGDCSTALWRSNKNFRVHIGWNSNLDTGSCELPTGLECSKMTTTRGMRLS